MRRLTTTLTLLLLLSISILSQQEGIAPPPPSNELATKQIDSGKFSDAIKTIDELLIKKTNINRLKLGIRAAQGLNDLEKEITYAEGLVKLNSKSKTNVKKVVDLFRKSKNETKLILYLEKYRVLTKSNKGFLRKTLVELQTLYSKKEDKKNEYSVVVQLVSIFPRNEKYLFQKGKIEFTNKKYSKAYKNFKKVEDISPYYRELSYYLGYSALKIGNDSTATENLRRAARKDKSNLDIRTALAELYVKIGEKKNAILEYQTILRLKPNDPEIIKAVIPLYEEEDNKLGMMKMYKKYQEIATKKDLGIQLKLAAIISEQSEARGLDEYKKALDIDPKSRKALTNILAYYTKKNKNDSMFLYMEKLFPLSPTAENGKKLADAYLKAKDSLKAMNPLSHYLKKYKKDYKSIYILGEIYMQAKKYKKATVLFTQLKNIKPKFRKSAKLSLKNINLRLARSLKQTGKLSDSKKAYILVIDSKSKTNKELIESQKFLAEFYLGKENWSSSIKSLLSLKKLKVEESLVVTGLAKAYYNSGKTKKAIPYLEKTYKKSSDKLIAEKLANAYISQRDFKNASKYLKIIGPKAVELFGSNLTAAESYIKTKNTEKAKPILEKIIKKNPKNSKALSLLATLLEDDKDFLGATSVLQKLYKVKAKKSIKKRIGDDFLKISKDLEAAKSYEVYIGEKPTSKHKSLLDTLANIYRKKDKISPLASTLRKLIKLSPKNKTYFLELGKIEYSKKKFKSASAYLSSAERLGVKSNELSRMLAVSLYNTKKYKKAEKFLNLALLDDAKNVEFIKMLTACYKKRNDTKNIAIQLEKLLSINGNDIKLINQLIGLHEKNKNYSRLLELYKTKMSINKKRDFSTIRKIARIYRSKKDYDKSIKLYNEILQIKPESKEALNALVDAYQAKRNVVKATEYLNKLVLIAPSDKLQLRLAQIHLAQGDTNSAIDPLSQYSVLKPKDLNAQVLLTKCYLAQKDFSSAEFTISNVVSSIKSAKKRKKGLPNKGVVYYLLGLSQYGNMNKESATESFKLAVKFDSKNADAFYKIGEFYYEIEDWKNTVKYFSVADKLAYKSPAIKRGLALGYYAQRKYKKASTYLEIEFNKNKDDLVLLEQLVRSFLASKNDIKTAKYLDLINKKDVTIMGSNLSAVNVYIRLKKNSAAEKMLLTITELDPFNIKALKKLSKLYKSTKKYSKAIETLKKLYEAEGKAIVQKEIGEIYLSIKKPLAAAEALEVYVESNPKDKASLKKLWKIYESKNDAERLYPILSKLVAVDKFNVEARAELGKIAFKQGNFDEAILHFVPVVKKKPLYKRANYILGESYYNIGSFKKAEKFLILAIKKSPKNLSLNKHLADVFLKNGKKLKSAKYYEKVLVVKKQDLDIIEILIEIYEYSTKKDRLISLYRKREKLNGEKDSGTLLKIAKLYILQKNKSAAQKTYKEVLSLDDSNILALRALIKLVEKKDRPLAIKYLEKVVQFEGKLSDNRKLARLYLLSSDSTKALRPLEFIYNSGKSKVSEKKDLAYCYLSKKNYDNAIELFSSVVPKVKKKKRRKKKIQTKEEALLFIGLGNAYKGAGDNTKAVKAYLQGVKTVKDKIALTFLASYYLKNGKYSSAISPLVSLEKKGKASQQITKGLALAYFKTKKYKKALPYLASLKKNKKATEIQIYNLAVVYSVLGNKNKAPKAIKDALIANRKNSLNRFDFGTILFNAGEYSSAKDILKNITSKFPKKSKAWSMLADIYGKNKNNAQEIIALEHYLALKPKESTKYSSRLAFAYTAIGNDKKAVPQLKIALKTKRKNKKLISALITSARKRKNNKDLLFGLSLLSNIDSKNVSVLMEIMELQLSKKSTKSALSTISKILKINPTNNKIIVLQAKLLYKSKGKNVLNALKNAVKKSPTDKELNFMLAETYSKISLKKKNKVESAKIRANAIKYYLVYLKSANKDIKTLRKVSKIAEKANDTKNSEIIYKLIIQNDAKDVSTRLKLANYYKKSKSKNKAISIFSDVLSIKSHNIAALTSLIDLYEKNKDYKNAAKISYKYTQTKKGKNKRNFLKLGDLRKKIKDLKGAIVAFEAAIALSPKSDNVFYEIALLYETLGDNSKAAGAARKAVSLKTSKKKGYRGPKKYKETLARTMFAVQEYDVASKIYKDLIKIDPKKASNYFHLAECYQKNEQKKIAAKYFKKAYNLNKTNKKYLKIAADAYLVAGLDKGGFELQKKLMNSSVAEKKNIERLLSVARGAYASKKSKEALKYYQKVALLDKTRLFNEWPAALVNYDSKNYKLAESILAKLVIKKSKDKKLWLMLAKSRIALNNKKSAIDAYESYYMLTKSSKIKGILAALYFDLGKKDKSAAAYEVYLKNNKKDKKALVRVYGIYKANGNIKALKSSLKKMVSVYPRNVSYLSELANLELKSGNLKSAEKYFALSSKLPSAKASIFSNLGAIRFNAKKYSSARKPLTKAVKLNSKDQDSRKKLITVLLSSKEKTKIKVLATKKETVLHLEKYLLVDSNNLLFWNKLISLYESLSIKAKLEKSYKKVISLDSKNDNIRLKLARLYKKKKIVSKAIALYKDYLILVPNSKEALLYVAENLKKTNPSEAINYYSKYISSGGKVSALLERALLKKTLNNIVGATKDFESFIKTKGNKVNKIALSNLFKIYKKSNDKKNIKRILLTLAKIAKTNVEYSYLLGEMHFSAKEYNSALSKLLNANKLKPNFKKCSEMIGLAYTKIKKPNRIKAVPFLRKASLMTPSNVEVRRTLAGIYKRSKKKSSLAIIEYEAVLKYDLKDLSSAKILAKLYEKKASKSFNSKLIKTYERIVNLDTKDIKTFLKLASLYKKSKRISNAITAYEKIIGLDNKNYIALKTLAEIFYTKKDYINSAKYYEKVVPIAGDEREANIRYKLGFIYLKNLKDKKNAEIHLTEAVNLNGLLFDANYELGLIFEGRKQYSEAFAYYMMADAGKPMVKYSFKTALMGFKSNDYENARSYFQTTLRRDPKNHESADYLGQIYIQKRRYGDAAKYFAKAVKIKPNNINYQRRYANSLFSKENYKFAIPAFKKVIALDSKDYKSTAKLAKSLISLKKGKQSLVYLNKVYRFSFNLIEDDFNVATTFFKFKKNTEALKICLNVLKTHPENSKANKIVAKIYDKRKDYKQAIRFYLSAIEADSKQDKLNKRIGELYLELGRKKEAMIAFEDYLKSGSKDKAVIKILLNNYRSNKDPENTRRLLNKVIKSDNRNYQSLYDLASMDLSAGNTKSALLLLNKALKLKPRFHAALLLAGQTHLKVKNYKLAAPKLKLAILIKQSDYETMASMADYYFIKKNHKSYIKLYKKMFLKKKDAISLDRLIFGYKALKNDNLRLQYLQKKVVLDSKSWEDYLSIGHIYLKQKKDLKAESAFKKATSISRECFDGFKQLALMYDRKNKTTDAINMYKKALYLDKRQPNLHFSLGAIYLAKGDSAPAMDEMEKVLLDAPNHLKTLEKLGYLYISFNFHQKAINTIGKLVKRKPKNPKGYAALGSAYLATKNYKKAQQNLQKALTYNLKDAQTHFVLGNLFVKTKKIKSAIASYKKAHIYSPKNKDYLNTYGNFLYENKKYKTAIAILKKMYNSNPKNTEALTHLADCYLKIGNTKSATVYLLKIEKVAPSWLSKNYDAAKAYYKNKKYKKALAIMESIGKSEKKEFYSILSILYQKEKKMKKASRAMENLLEIDPGDKNVRMQAAELFLKRGSEDKAMNYYEIVIRSWPKTIKAHEALRNLYAKDIENRGTDLRISLEKLISLKPRKSSYYFELAKLIWDQEGSFGEAAPYIKKAILYKKNDVYAAALYGKMLLKQKQYKKAKIYLLKAAKSPKLRSNLSLTKDLGIYYYSVKSYKMAIKYLKVVLAKDIKDASIYLPLQVSYQKSKQKLPLKIMYQTILKSNSDNAFANKGLGDIAYKNKKYFDAINAYLKVVEVDRNDYKSYNRLSQMYRKEKKVNKAIDMCERSLQANPNQDDVAYIIGTILLEDRNNEEAAKEKFENVILMNPKHYKSYTKLGDIYSEQGDRKMAIANYEKSLSIKKKDINTIRSLAVLYVKEKNRSKALPLLKIIIAKDKKDWQGRLTIAKYYLEMNKTLKALPLLEQVLRIKKNNVDAQLLLVDSYIAIKKMQKAIPILERLSRMGDPEMKLKLAVIYYKLGNIPKAKMLLDRLLSKQDGTPEATFVWGEIYYKTINFKKLTIGINRRNAEKAKKIFQKVVIIDPNYYEAHFRLGLLSKYSGDEDLAIAEFEKVLEIKSTHLKAKTELASQLLLKRRYDESEKLFLEILKKSPKNKNVLFALGKTYFFTAKYKKAISKLRASITLGKEDVYFYLIESYIKVNQKKNANIYLAKAKKKYPRSAQIEFSAANIQLSYKRINKALKGFQAVLRKDPKYADAYLACGNIFYKHKKNTAAAVANYKRYMSKGGDLTNIPEDLKEKVAGMR